MPEYNETTRAKIREKNSVDQEYCHQEETYWANRMTFMVRSAESRRKTAHGYSPWNFYSKTHINRIKMNNIKKKKEWDTFIWNNCVMDWY